MLWMPRQTETIQKLSQSNSELKTEVARLELELDDGCSRGAATDSAVQYDAATDSAVQYDSGEMVQLMSDCSLAHQQIMQRDVELNCKQVFSSP